LVKQKLHILIFLQIIKLFFTFHQTFHTPMFLFQVVNLCLWAVSGAIMLAILYGPFEIESG